MNWKWEERRKGIRVTPRLARATGVKGGTLYGSGNPERATSLGLMGQESSLVITVRRLLYKEAISSIILELGRGVEVVIKLGIINVEMILKARRLNEITHGVSVLSM